MEHAAVSSSYIASIAHEGSVLEVKMKNGKTYQVFGVSAEKHQEILDSDSVGQEFSKLKNGGYQIELKEDLSEDE